MSLVINLGPSEEEKVFEAARKMKMTPSEWLEMSVRGLLTPESIKPIDKVQAKLRQWQEETATEMVSHESVHDLFARWAAEDALLTEEEQEAAEKLWRDFEKGVNDTRLELGMRLL